MVVRVDDRHHRLGGLFESQGAAHDPFELRRTPEPLAQEVGLEDPRPGRIQRQAQPLRILLGFPLGLGQREFLALAGIDVEHQADDLVRRAGRVAVQLRLDLHPAALAIRQHRTEVHGPLVGGRILYCSRPAACDPLADPWDVIRMGDRPANAGGLFEGQRPTDHVGEFRRAPECLVLEVSLVDAGAGRVQSDLQALRVDLGFASCVDQSGDLATVHHIAELLSIQGSHRPILALQPALTAGFIDVALLRLVDQGRPLPHQDVHLDDLIGDAWSQLLDAQPDVVARRAVGDRFPRGARRLATACAVEQRRRPGRNPG